VHIRSTPNREKTYSPGPCNQNINQSKQSTFASSVILFKTGNRVLILIFTAIVRSLVRCLLHRAWSEMDISYIFTHDPLWAVTHTAWSGRITLCLFVVLTKQTRNGTTIQWKVIIARRSLNGAFLLVSKRWIRLIFTWFLELTKPGTPFTLYLFKNGKPRLLLILRDVASGRQTKALALVIFLFS